MRGDIISGRLEVGSAVPSERVLAEEFGVNRHAVREALKRLEQAGLVRITHGGATRVLDWRDTGGLEVLLDLMGGSTVPTPEMVRSVLEMRASIGVDAARHCAVRATPEQRGQVRELAEQSAAQLGVNDEMLDLSFAAMWHVIVTGSGNIAYRLALNSLLKAMLAYGDNASQIRPTDPEAIRALGDAIARGDEAASVEVARRMLEADVHAFG